MRIRWWAVGHARRDDTGVDARHRSAAAAEWRHAIAWRVCRSFWIGLGALHVGLAGSSYAQGLAEPAGQAAVIAAACGTFLWLSSEVEAQRARLRELVERFETRRPLEVVRFDARARAAVRDPEW